MGEKHVQRNGASIEIPEENAAEKDEAEEPTAAPSWPAATSFCESCEAAAA